MISVILAHARLQDDRLGRPPLLILDDVAAHLDERRRTHLFALCSALRGQVWYSGADEHAFAPLSQNAQFFHVQNGQVTPSDASSRL
jgi:DNA replication and repair protein RecF